MAELAILLAAKTTESLAIFRVGPIVYKLLRDPASFADHPLRAVRMDADATLERWRRMAEISLTGPPFNPILFVEPLLLMVSRFVDGRKPAVEDVVGVRRSVAALGVRDVSMHNVVVGADGPVLVDWLMGE